MNEQPSPLALALERLTIFDLWKLLRLDGTPKPSCRSPFREDRNPSFSIYDHGRRWKDFATGKGGDVVDFCSQARNLSKEDGARLLI
jgi:DNA primase